MSRSNFVCLQRFKGSMTSRPEALDDFAIFSPFWFTLPEIVARTGHFFIIFNTQKAVISFGFTVERQMPFIM